MKRYGNIFRPLLVILLIAGIFCNVGSVIYQQRDKYLARDYWERFPVLKQTYLDSQYVNKNPKGWIPDEVVNAYAGGALITGINPILIISDTPPLGKYIIGASTLVFNNENISNLIFYVLAFVMLYLLCKQIFNNYIIALVIVLLVSFEPLLKNQLVYSPLYDVFQLFFMISAFYFFNRGLSNKNSIIINFFMASILLGCFISTKFFATGTLILIAWYIYLFIHKDFERIIKLTITSPAVILVLLISYVKIFSFGYNVRDFFGIQKWIFLYHQHQLILPFSIWPLLLFNQWYVWWGDKPVISDPQWLYTWPIITIMTLITIIVYVLRKIPHNKVIEPLMIWVMLYFLFFSFGQITSRYLIILLPILYIIYMYGVVSFYYLIKKKVT